MLLSESERFIKYEINYMVTINFCRKTSEKCLYFDSVLDNYRAAVVNADIYQDQLAKAKISYILV